MFRIRRVFDARSPANVRAIARVQEILREQFPEARPGEADAIPEKLSNHLKYGFQTILFVAEKGQNKVHGFALILYDPLLKFCYLDYIAVAGREAGSGLGSILYERVRKEALDLGCVGVFFECLPDDPALSRSDTVRKQNVARLRFYERYGATPVVGTKYETPLEPEGDNPPYLLFDALGKKEPLRREKARLVVAAILGKKYGALCSPEYIRMVMDSFRDDPVKLRPLRYVGAPTRAAVASELPESERIALFVNRDHAIHHVRERGYVESPVRVEAILKEIVPSGLFSEKKPRHFGEKHILKVHGAVFFHYLRKVCLSMPEGESVYPYVFPVRNAARPPQDLSVRAGYFCMDTFTPLNRNAFLAALGAVDCALSGAQSLVEGRHLAYALVRPPGHHAERRLFGGFCYLNSGAAAAEYLSAFGKVAMLDLDYHHGNGQQDIFYARKDVLTVSLHGHPRFAYPYFSGFEDERGEGEGRGYSLNIPLPEKMSGSDYVDPLRRAIRRIEEFAPSFLVVALGGDTCKNDPTGTWSLAAKDFEINGRLLGALDLPVLVIQEGGYNTRLLGENIRSFFKGLFQSSRSAGSRLWSPAPRDRRPARNG